MANRQVNLRLMMMKIPSLKLGAKQSTHFFFEKDAKEFQKNCQILCFVPIHVESYMFGAKNICVGAESEEEKDKEEGGDEKKEKEKKTRRRRRSWEEEESR